MRRTMLLYLWENLSVVHGGEEEQHTSSSENSARSLRKLYGKSLRKEIRYLPALFFTSVFLCCFVFKTTYLFSLQLLLSLINWFIYLFTHSMKFFEAIHIPDTLLGVEERNMKIHSSYPQEAYNWVGKQICWQLFVMTIMCICIKCIAVTTQPKERMLGTLGKVCKRGLKQILESHHFVQHHFVRTFMRC